MAGVSKTINKSIRLRFAPSPTGYLHVGGARTALFNYLYAKSHGGKFILRIEDTDQTRSTQEAVDQVLASLRWLGIDWDEGPGKPPSSQQCGSYYQSQRLSIYQQYFERLLKENKVYHCFCSDEELNNKRKKMEAMGIPYVYDKKCLGMKENEINNLLEQQTPHVLRFKVDKKNIIFEDQVKGIVKFDTGLIGDFVIRKSDGFPTYNFAVVVDDATMEISHVLRGDDHISNTPRQILIYEALDYPVPIFAHISMILGHDGEKLSKRYGAISVLDFKEEGYYPDPFINFLALLGWTPRDGKEIIDREKLKQSFIDLKFSSSPAIFDTNKLNFLNGQYLRNLDIHILNSDLKQTLSKNGVETFPDNIDAILEVLKDYCSKLNDIVPVYQNFIKTEIDYPEHLHHWINEDRYQQLFHLAIQCFSQNQDIFIDPLELKELNKKAKQELSLGGKEFFMPLRVKLTGEEHGIELDTLFRLKDRKFILKRLAK